MQTALALAPTDVSQLVLTKDQEAALLAFYMFLTDSSQQVFVLRGYSGCGKSTLVHTLLDRLPGYLKAARLIMPSLTQYEAVLSATTNKAAENLAQITGYDVKTIHAVLGLRVVVDYSTKVSRLVPRDGHEALSDSLLFIDEASYIDQELKGYVFKRTHNCKIVFIGDPAQLTPVMSSATPVFDAPYPGAALTQVVRQAKDNPIVNLSTKFRETVNSGQFFSFVPDGHHIQHIADREQFKREIAVEFTRPDWKYKDSKILAWTNKCVIDFNQFVSNLVKGDPHFQVGDYAVVNTFVQVRNAKVALKTDQLVQITTIEPGSQIHGVDGNWVTLDHKYRLFHPKSLAAKNASINAHRKEGEMNAVIEMEAHWVDLRGAYGCTINKAQGSTFGSVYIDLDDIKRCTSGNQIARMLYVAVSRAKNHVFLTGDLA